MTSLIWLILVLKYMWKFIESLSGEKYVKILIYKDGENVFFKAVKNLIFPLIKTFINE